MHAVNRPPLARILLTGGAARWLLTKPLAERQEISMPGRYSIDYRRRALLSPDRKLAVPIAGDDPQAVQVSAAELKQKLNLAP
jgi:hypothetical protein